MAWMRSCLVCGDPVAGSACATCGADASSVEEALQAAEPLVVPTFWQTLWRRGALTPPVSEALWQGLSSDFKESLLREYRSAQRCGHVLTTLVMFPLTLALLASCFWAGVAGARWLGMAGGKEREWLSGVGGMLLLLPLRMAPLGANAEGLLLRGRAEAGVRGVLERAPLVGLAVLSRCPKPWYVNPDVLFPVAVALVLTAAWLIL
jgi:hypothetical protein